jgi:hypothetical protein
MGNVIGNHWEHGGNIKIVGKKSQTTHFKTPVPFKKKKNWALGHASYTFSLVR